jgi:hypothetical protein
MKYFNEKALEDLKRGVRRAPSGFRYGFVPGIFREEVYEAVVDGFPDVTSFRLKDLDEKHAGGGRKRFYAGPSYYSGAHYGSSRMFTKVSDIWRGIIEEADSEEFKGLLSDATSVPFNSICNLGFAYGKEGSVQEAHLDGAVTDMRKAISSSIACLLYLNREPGGVCGTRVYAPDRTTVLYEVPDLRNSLFFFEQHQDAWHGFPEVPAGANRRILSLSYSREPVPIRLRDDYLYGKLPLSAKKLLQRLS